MKMARSGDRMEIGLDYVVGRMEIVDRVCEEG